MSTKSKARNAISGHDLNESCETIMEFLKEYPGSSRYEIHQGTGYRLSSICGRCNELINADLIKVIGRKLDHETGKMVECLSVGGTHGNQ